MGLETNDHVHKPASPLTVQIPSSDNNGTDDEQLTQRPNSPIPSQHVEGGERPRLQAADVHPAFEPKQTQAPFSSWSASSDKQLGSPSASNDRVFPVSSVVSVDPSHTPYVFGERNSKEHTEYFPPGTAKDRTGRSPSRNRQSGQSTLENSRPRTSLERQNLEDKKASVSNDERFTGAERMRLFSDATSEQSSQRASSTGDPSGASRGNSLGSFTPGDRESLKGLVTARFKHIITEDGHAVITGRDGETLQRCEDEPIHIPGAVQSFGLLIALEEDEESQLLVRIVSENSYRMIGYHPQELFRLSSFTDILSEEQVDNLLDHIDFIRDDEADPATNGPEVFTISIRGPTTRRSKKLWCAMHINPSNPDVIICEFELDDDQLYPLVPANDALTPDLPEDTLHSQPTEEEYTDSTLPTSKPLRVLRSARKRKGEAAAMEVFNIMSQVQEQLASAPNLDSFLKILVGVVKELTGFHRVMIYQFDSSFNGRVVTELVDPRATKDLYKGLNFPASDIPRQARDLYKVNKVRLLYDRDLETARLVCRTVEDLEHPLDLSFSYLRAMSPIHIKYLTNMAVRSSMSISINAFGELWGLIACHTYGPKGMRVSFPIRKMCRLVGDTASRNIERLSYASRLQARKLINTVPTETNPSGYIIASSDDLLKLFDADFGLLSIRGETKMMGKIEQTQEALAMLEYLRLRNIASVVTSQDIRADFPDLRYSPGFDVIAGLLLVPLSVGGSDFIVFFRKGQIREVKWAGNPYEKFTKEGSEGFLEPRKSFKSWTETVVGKCREWTSEQVETAAVLCLVYGKFIEVWRQKETAMQNSQLTKILLANSAHEVRTPLNAIINYLEIALEGALDQETRDNIAKSHSASKSLIYVINDLLDLTKIEEGQDLIKDEIFDLPATVREATDAFKGDVTRKGLEYEVAQQPSFPRFVYGDQRRIRQIITNLVANSVQHTSSGWIHVEMWLLETNGDKANIEIVIQDSGCGMSDEKLDMLFRDLEQVSEDHAHPLNGFGSQNQDLIMEKGDRALGLGLAMVARIIRNANGQLRVKSEQGKGSRFVIQLQFHLPDTVPEGGDSTDRPSLEKLESAGSLTSLLGQPQAADGEVTLVEKGSSTRVEGVVVQQHNDNLSLKSIKSGSSNRSKGSNASNTSNKSDLDRLIDAISGPLSATESSSEQHFPKRSNSKGSGQSRNSGRILSSRPSSAHDKPGKLVRSKSYGATEHLQSHSEGLAGSELVTDNKTALKAIRMPDEFSVGSSDPNTKSAVSQVSFDLPYAESERPNALNQQAAQQTVDHLQILVAEDDPINVRIIKKRLAKSGHEIYHTINGEECASAYGERPTLFDVVLMDMQMPIVDGLTSTKMIRSFEKTHSGPRLSPRASINGRVPIFAVSASLVERELQTYIDAGFDGWILKPIDFKRLTILFSGIINEDARNDCLYEPGKWEKGGWFFKRQPPIAQTITKPSLRDPVSLTKESAQLDSNSHYGSGSGLVTPIYSGDTQQMRGDTRLSHVMDDGLVLENQRSAEAGEETIPNATPNS